MSAFLWEAARLAAETAHSGCPVSDTAAFLDAHPAIRLSLEDTWTDPFGRVYREAPVEYQSRWPIHLARAFKTLLKIGHDPAQVFRLLDLLHALDASDAVLKLAIKGSIKHRSLEPAIGYFESLVAEFDSVTTPKPEEETPLGVSEPRCRPRIGNGNIEVQVWYLPDNAGEDENGPPDSPCYRAYLLHDPTTLDVEERDWISVQPKDWQAMYWAIRKADIDQLAFLRERLLRESRTRWTRDQAAVLWTTYHSRRAKVRREREKQAARHLGSTARKLIARIRRVRTEKEHRWVGFNLHRAMRGEIPLPGSVSDGEWSVIFSAHRRMGTELLRRGADPVPSLSPRSRPTCAASSSSRG